MLFRIAALELGMPAHLPWHSQACHLNGLVEIGVFFSHRPSIVLSRPLGSDDPNEPALGPVALSEGPDVDADSASR